MDSRLLAHQAQLADAQQLGALACAALLLRVRCRLQDGLKLRERELDAAKKETTTLRSSLAGAQRYAGRTASCVHSSHQPAATAMLTLGRVVPAVCRTLEQRALEADRLKERALKAEG